MRKDLIYKRWFRLFAVAVAASIFIFSFTTANAQTRRKKAKKPVVVVAQPTPPIVTEPVIISRANDYQENAPVTTSQSVAAADQEPVTSPDTTNQQIIALSERIKELESDAKQRRLLLNLDIITRAEQRAESLRKQRFELVEKENSLQTRLDQIENDIRPEVIEKAVALTGSLRPEELRENRRKSLDTERRNTQALLIEVQSTRSRLEQSVQTAEELVEKLRVKLEKEIDDALVEKKPNQ